MQLLPFYEKSVIIAYISKEEDAAMAEKIKPLIVALDTNVFDNANYFYSGLDLGILKQYIDDGVIGELIISDVVVRECKRHLSESAENLVEDFAAKFDSLEWKRASTIGALMCAEFYRHFSRGLKMRTILLKARFAVSIKLRQERR